MSKLFSGIFALLFAFASWLPLPNLFFTRVSACYASAVTRCAEQPDPADLQIYPVPKGTPQSGKSFFQVTADQYPVGVYTDLTPWEGNAHFAYVNMREGREVTFRVNANFRFRKVKVLPESLGIEPQVCRGQVSFTVSQPNQNITLVFDDHYNGHTLHLFTNPIDDDAPTESGENLVYFGPGYHFLKEQLDIGANQTLYIAPGAVVDGRIRLEAAHNAAVRGSGVLMNSVYRDGGEIILQVGASGHVTIEGIVFSSQQVRKWNLATHNVNGMAIRNVKIVSPRYASTDGMDINNSRNVTVAGCFIRTGDDCIAIKGFDASLPAENIVVENCVLWNEVNNAMALGAETKALYYRNIIFRNIDVLFSYDDRDHHGELDERSVMSIVSLHSTYFEDITWEDIRVNRCERLICLTFVDSFWFGSIPGDQTAPGGMRNVAFRNISSDSPDGKAARNEILLSGNAANGGNPEKMIENVVFDNVEVNGAVVTESYRKLQIRGPVTALAFRA